MRHHTLTLPIHIPRLTLREFHASDFDGVFASASDPEVTRFMLGLQALWPKNLR